MSYPLPSPLVRTRPGQVIVDLVDGHIFYLPVESARRLARDILNAVEVAAELVGPGVPTPRSPR